MLQNITSIYNPGNLTEQGLIDGFVIRTNEYNNILKRILNSKKMINPPQHIIIQGQRGTGKTTLLCRLCYEIKRNEELKNMVPVLFNEELYGVYSLLSFWEKLVEYLNDIEVFKGISEEVYKIIDEEANEPKVFEKIEEYLNINNKKLIIFIDNFDEILNKFSEIENRRLREVLTTSADIWIIGGSANIMEVSCEYLQPFFEFFETYELKELSKKDTESLLMSLGKNRDSKDINKILNENSSKIETLRRLTGGVPRTIVLLYDILIDTDTSHTSYKNLDLLLDKVTPLYKHRMDDLKGVQQPIVNAIALNWDKILIDEILKKTRLNKEEVEKELGILSRNNIILKETIGENILYSIRERFLNIWYLMRCGKKRDIERVKWISRFLEEWCNRDEISSRVQIHLEYMKEGKLDVQHAYNMTIALAETKHLDNVSKRQFLTQSKEYFKDNSPDLFEEIGLYTKDKYRIMSESELIQLSKSGDHIASYELGRFYHVEKKEYKKAEEYYKKAEEQGDVGALLNLGVLYKNEYKEYKKAEEYYKKAEEQGDVKALLNLGILYKNEYKEYKKAEEYYKKAEEQGDVRALLDLGVLYDDIYKDYKKAEEYYKKAEEQGNVGALNNLGILYYKVYKEYKKAEKYYKKAVERGNIYGLANLGLMYLELDRFDKSIFEFERFLNKLEPHELESEKITNYFLDLMAKKQYSSLLRLLKENSHNIKERYKPVYYALMYFMQDEFPLEFKKMGSELDETVKEIIKKVKEKQNDLSNK
ncbi:UNVERIFIED_CONTAM: TPR repeat protein [Acetivibrio alkalicellulosi]